MGDAKATNAHRDDGFPSLQPLRIPAGCKVTWNSLYEPTSIAKFQDFLNEDIFMAELDGRVVDLGWYPAGDRDGRYVLMVVGPRADEDDDPWSHPLYRFETRSRADVIADLERILRDGIYP